MPPSQMATVSGGTAISAKTEFLWFARAKRAAPIANGTAAIAVAASPTTPTPRRTW